MRLALQLRLSGACSFLPGKSPTFGNTRNWKQRVGDIIWVLDGQLHKLYVCYTSTKCLVASGNQMAANRDTDDV